MAHCTLIAKGTPLFATNRAKSDAVLRREPGQSSLQFRGSESRTSFRVKTKARPAKLVGPWIGVTENLLVRKATADDSESKQTEEAERGNRRLRDRSKGQVIKRKSGRDPGVWKGKHGATDSQG